MSSRTPVNPELSGEMHRFVNACRDVDGIEAIKEVALDMGANVSPFGFEIVHDDYPYNALDVILPDKPSNQRVFVHETFPGEQQEDAEDIIRAAELGFLPTIFSNEHFTFRKTPIVTARLLAHNTTKPTVETIARSFLGPTLQQLYDARGVVPSASTLANLVHVESIETVRGRDTLETGVRFVPPYDFEATEPDAFVATAVKNAILYGEPVAKSLKNHLAHPITSS